MVSIMKMYKTSEKMKYEPEQVWFPLSEDILSWDDDLHELMLNDEIRMVAYEKAIKEAVKPGMTVVDVGTGTGILALWALEAGASQVYGIDVNAARIPQAVRRISDAGFSGRFIHINDLSYKVELPERVDVCISEILGNLADNEDMIPILADARKRFLKDEGLMLPRKVMTYLTPVSSVQAHEQVKKRECRGINGSYNLDDLLARLNTKNPFNLYYDCILPESTYVGEPQAVAAFNFDGKDQAEYRVNVNYTVVRAGMLTGFKGDFLAELSDSVVLDISGGDITGRTTSDCWKHCYLPIEKPIEVQKGDVIELEFSRFYPKEKSTFRQCYAWEGRVSREGSLVQEFGQYMGSVVSSLTTKIKEEEKTPLFGK